MKQIELHNDAIAIINSKFNIILAEDCRNFDLNFDYLSTQLDLLYKDTFDSKDRILLVHMDTDYYDPLLPCGLLISNIIRLLKNKNFPLCLLLFVTNHFGIKKEFDLLLRSHDESDRPTIVETLLSPLLLPIDISESTQINLEEIEYPGLCMLGKHRSHRAALVNFFLENNLLSKVALQTNFI